MTVKRNLINDNCDDENNRKKKYIRQQTINKSGKLSLKGFV